MIVVDTSAVVAILKNEPEGERCLRAITASDDAVMSAGSFQELRIVAAANNLSDVCDRLMETTGLRIEPVTATLAAAGGRAWRRYGRGRHPAGLNFGDCFAYALADGLNAPLLFVGDDFAKTDVTPA